VRTWSWSELNDRLARVREGGDEQARRRHVKSGKLLVRDRVELLCDPGAPFLELSPLAAGDLYADAAPGAGIVTGVGTVSGRTCMIVTNDATVKGRHLFPADGQEAPARTRDRAP
jgi:3-methylcrotonyl-CoA carboxylase beta subunit